MWLTGLVAPRHVGSSRTRDRTRVPCIGRRILNHCATREARLVHFKMLLPGFPGGAVVENLPANAGAAGSSPGLGRSHMPRSNSAREPHLLSLRVWSLCSATRGRDSERPARRNEEWPLHRDEEWPPLATTRESPRTETKTQHSHTYIHTYIHKKNVSRQE